MALSALIKKRHDRDLATATPAIPATQHTESTERVAKVATIAVANPIQRSGGAASHLHVAKVATIAIANRKEEQDSERLELTNLVRFIADFHGFTEEEHDEALTIALADFDNALVCFRALKQDALSMGSSTRLKSAGNTYPSTEAKELSLSLPDARREAV
ncbi:hypothetical protein SAMN05216404_11923 [Nitrosospira multiformis]|uniref:Uncharacterized protein n=1 Tax=Nitrosospira multiformis TaxID=1231 RepID=A0A1H8P5Z5_9PROT|nr:hypothetical protein [Nitrosospira multiformis]SEO37164.1 hypothetical protein SAMN05216404_11923 [Nitrosospira multiformis]